LRCLLSGCSSLKSLRRTRSKTIRHQKSPMAQALVGWAKARRSGLAAAA
jgi:hypothetical protein